MSKLIRGDKLPSELRQRVLSAFIYRWTRENTQRASAWGQCPACDIRNPYVNSQSAEGHKHPTLPLISDSEWLAQHAFYVTNGGRLDSRYRSCEPGFLSTHN